MTGTAGVAPGVIEDVVPLYDLGVSVRLDRPLSAVRCVPQGTALPFTVADGRARFTVPELGGHQMIELAFA